VKTCRKKSKRVLIYRDFNMAKIKKTLRVAKPAGTKCPLLLLLLINKKNNEKIYEKIN
jgi:hypothetical protein